MAPCGCFFDPRIYHIEWITNEFPHAPVYKLLEVPRLQNVLNTNQPENQRLVKDLVQSFTYRHNQQLPKSNQTSLSHYNQEDPIDLTKQDNAVEQQRETPRSKTQNPKKQGSTHRKEVKLPQLVVTVPGLKQDGNSLPTSVYTCLKKRFPPEDQLRLSGLDKNQQEFPMYDNYPENETEVPDCSLLDTLILDPEVMNICGGSGMSPVSSPCDSHNGTQLSDPQQSIKHHLVERKALNVTASRSLPEEVLLEDAMKMFDCIPGNVDLNLLTEESRVDKTQYRGQKPHVEEFDMSITGSISPWKDSLSDISLLNLPDELLSPDYSVPEISDTVGSMDYFYNIKEFDEEHQSDDEIDHDLAENQLTKQNIPFVKKMKVSIVKNSVQPSCGPKPIVSSGRCPTGIQNCLEEMEN
ncbi:hypothetical protein NDU88_005043 [Pleurodeles waltl]|uniref:Uncharacterized protein n=1 Tax=Pleurodeles waltl TaxID=8319 RepID=A0AAV7L6C8_PLEWA|nr:hypothetical protein NDU88_005043 [Pleurodeles waltl]